MDNSKRKRWTLVAVLGTIIVLIVCIVSVVHVARWKLHTPRYHYELSEELGIAFTNADYVIEQMRKSLQAHDEKILIDYAADGDHMGDIGELVRELMDCALSETDSPSQGDYIKYQLGGYELEYGYEEQNGIYRYQLVITPSYYTTLQQEAKVDELVEQILRDMNFDKTASDAEKVRRINDYVCATVKYDMVHRNKDLYHLKSTAYAALVNKRAVCQGYSVLMYRLLREAGVNTRVVTGTLQDNDTDEYHAWNLVEIDGVWYNLDVTWDVMLETEDYYLKTDGSMTDHIRDGEFASEEFYEQYPMAREDYRE